MCVCVCVCVCLIRSLKVKFICAFKYRTLVKQVKGKAVPGQTLKTDSHIACRAHAVPMPRPYHALPLRVKIVSFQFDLHIAAVSDTQSPCHALTMSFFSRPRHSTAVERRPVGYLPAFGFFGLLRGVPRRLLSEAYQSSLQRSIPTTIKRGSSTLQKDALLNCWTSSSDISGDHADFHEGHGTVGVGKGRGMACVN
jgi:hypothetical protein